jgi:hypothetical protein
MPEGPKVNQIKEIVMNITTTRRRFIEIVPVAGVALFAASSSVIEPTYASTAPVTGVAALVGEKDAQAIALGYVDDATRADKVKFKTYVVGSQCSGCALYLGKAGDSAGGCPVFQGKNVAAKGWCSAWAKKA